MRVSETAIADVTVDDDGCQVVLLPEGFRIQGDSVRVRQGENGQLILEPISTGPSSTSSPSD
jgi:virulence-associated protein VagC